MSPIKNRPAVNRAAIKTGRVTQLSLYIKKSCLEQVKVKTMNDVSTLTEDAAKAVEAVPTVITAVQDIAHDFTSGNHQSVLAKVNEALGVAAQSAQALGSDGVIGHNDAANVAQGAGLAAEIEALAAKIEAFIKHVF